MTVGEEREPMIEIPYHWCRYEDVPCGECRQVDKLAALAVQTFNSLSEWELTVVEVHHDDKSGDIYHVAVAPQLQIEVPQCEAWLFTKMLNLHWWMLYGCYIDTSNEYGMTCEIEFRKYLYADTGGPD